MPFTNWQIVLCAIPIMLLLTTKGSMALQNHAFKRSYTRLMSMFSSTDHVQRICNLLHPLSTADIEQIARRPNDSVAIKMCLDAVESISLKDVGLSKDVLNKVRESVCMNIFSCNNFHLAIFIIPKGSRLPLHDHPNMTVLSKVLSGDLRIREFNIINKRSEDLRQAEYAGTSLKTVTDKAWLLSAKVNNVHDFEAMSTTAVFDILLPPYKEPDRPCTYFQIPPSTNKQYKVGDKVKLQSIKEPTAQLPYAVKYTGKKPYPPESPSVGE